MLSLNSHLVNQGYLNCLRRSCTLANFTYNSHRRITSIHLHHIIMVTILSIILIFIWGEIIGWRVGIICQLSKPFLLIIPLSKRLCSIVILAQTCMILISLNMPHLVVINWRYRSFWVYNTWPHRPSPFISRDFTLSYAFFDSSLALANPSSLFGAWVNINLTYDFISERV